MIEFSQRVQRTPRYPFSGAHDLPEDMVLMASNEVPDAPLPSVVAAIEATLGKANRYPDPTNHALRRALSDRFDVPAQRIAIGAGSCDLLMACGDVLLEPGAELVYAWPAFSVYPYLEAATGATGIRVPLNEQHEHDLDAMLAQITVATRLVIVCNPNNPTSTALPLDRITRFLEAVPRHVCVLLDEAYCEFNTLDDPDASVDLLAKHPNLVLLRTFSKVYGLCGLRVGYALCGDGRFVEAVDRIRQPFFCSITAQAAAIEALKHQDVIAERVERTVVARVELESALNELGIEPAASQANFCWFPLPEDGPDEAAVVKGLADRGVLIRGGTGQGREGFLRVTYGTPRDNARFVAALTQTLGR
ncbi:MAG: aminotransferase class I/II-fold pyridoxal phosphate-dependent enzyme [Solirubrobacterales bacterium]|nr:aminotransferase class I/II-fold pyridoxal phosphate-dependent enzyme [Solirubrobacterales bacterium]